MRTAARWLVPTAVTAVVVGGGVAASASSDATPDLPERTAEELLVAVQEAEPVPFSGTVRTVSSLGLPDLQGLAGPGQGQGEGAGAGTDPAALLLRLLSGENELRVWVGDDDQQRVSLVDDFSEVDVVRDGDVVWVYSSTEDTVVRHDLAAARAEAEAAWAEREAALSDEERARLEAELAEAEAAHEAAVGASPYADLTPDGVARQLLADAEETTDVAVGTPRVVAGRDAYTLTATPRDPDTLVGTIEVAVDAETGHVLQVGVQAVGQAEPALLTGFTSLRLGEPDPSVFDYEPAPGTTVVDPLEEKADEAPGSRDDAGERPWGERPDGDVDEPVVHGEGWSTVVELDLPEADAVGADSVGGDEARGDEATGDAAEVDAEALLGQLTSEVEGGRVLRTALVSVLLTDDGRVLVGAVRPETLLSHAG